MGEKIEEGKISLLVPKGVFFNTEMGLCRGIFSLCIGACGGKLHVIDAMCASGARGIRYAKENSNVKSLVLVDQSRRAIACARKNALRNKVKCKCTEADACKYLFEEKKAGSDVFLELDPFGSPQPFLYDSARFFSRKEGGFLSVTATDMAVLCGAQHKACVKNYSSVPLNNSFCHENAVRILIASAVRAFSPFNLSPVPLFSFSHRHYVKVLLKLEHGAEKAEEAAKSLGFVFFCHKCIYRGARRFPVSETCPHCNSRLEIAGPFYLGALWQQKFVETMIALNVKRNDGRKKDIDKMLRTILAESKIKTIGYYDLHEIAKKMGGQIRSMDESIAMLRKKGFAAERTHFCPTAVRTDAPHGDVINALSK